MKRQYLYKLLRLTRHKRFVPYGTHPNPSLSLRNSSMLRPLYARGARYNVTLSLAKQKMGDKNDTTIDKTGIF